ncbi:hypothetical protein ACFTAO_49010 [Paenibacillus rhizoplanae]
MKEDHMRNGQLKPGYNVQIGTEKPIYFNLQYTSKTDRHPLFRAASGKKAQQILGKWPKTVIADAGYGSEENYAYLEKERDTGGGEVRQLPQGKKLKPGKRMLVKSKTGHTIQPRIIGRAQLGTGCISTGKARRP